MCTQGGLASGAAELGAASRTFSTLPKRSTALSLSKSASIRRSSIKGIVKKAVTLGGSAAKSESNQAAAELEAEAAAGRGDCLLVLRRANLHEHRHYQVRSMIDV